MPTFNRRWRSMRCDGCDVDLIDLQTKMELRALSAGEDWAEFVDRASYAISTTSPSEMGPGFMTWVHIPAVPPLGSMQRLEDVHICIQTRLGAVDHRAAYASLTWD